jgi:hypothetical protein
MPARVHVFTGPTLNGREVRSMLPDAVLHPPAAAGDLAALPATAGDTVVLLDGLIAEGRAVRHKEILALLDLGVEVWGAGGLGALRAAELHASGMRPFGRVARLAIRGVLDGDDEVAVAHEGEAGRWASRGVALVDVRAVARWCHRRGLVDPETADAVVAVARALPFRSRRWDEILGRAVEAGLDAEMAWRVEQVVTRGEPLRLTRRDALGCLQAVRRRHGAPPRPRPAGAARSTTTVYALRWAEQRTGGVEHGAGFVGDLAVLSFCRLLGVDYPELQRHVALRTLAAATLPTQRASEREGQALVREFAEEQGLAPGDLPLWLAQRGLRRAELLARLRREVAVAALLEARGVDPRSPAAGAALARVVAEHARRRGFIASGAARGWERAWLSPAELESLTVEERIARLAARTFRCAPGVDWRAPLLQELKLRGAFGVAREGVADAQARWLAAGAAGADPEALLAWAAQRWGVRERLDLALLDRGFQAGEELLAAAPMVCALDRAVGTYRDLHCLGRRAAAAAS